jgi:hypothetical protein
VFHGEGDYAAFQDLKVEANERLALRILGYVLMPARPAEKNDRERQKVECPPELCPFCAT